MKIGEFQKLIKVEIKVSKIFFEIEIIFAFFKGIVWLFLIPNKDQN